MDCEYISDIEDEMHKLCKGLLGNPRVKRVNILIDTLMGVSVSYTSSGDPHSAEYVAEQKREANERLKNAL